MTGFPNSNGSRKKISGLEGRFPRLVSNLGATCVSNLELVELSRSKSI